MLSQSKDLQERVRKQTQWSEDGNGLKASVLGLLSQPRHKWIEGFESETEEKSMCLQKNAYSGQIVSASH